MQFSFIKLASMQPFAIKMSLALALVLLPGSLAWSQEEKAEAAAEEAVAEEKEKDPYEIPQEASVDELFKYMDGLMRIRPDRSNPAATAKKVFPTMIKAADIVLAKAEDDEIREKAISRQFQAYQILQRYDPSVAGAAKDLANKYASSDIDSIASLAVGFLLSEKGSQLRGASQEKAEEAAQEVMQFVKRFGPTRNSYSVASGIARTLGSSEHQEIAADIYEYLSEALASSEDEQIAKRAATMLGAARRMRLMGNPIEVFGTVASGEDFDWDSYKGKVVLVDFWASWCGPCIGELPNMKKNLAAYGEKGFEIVGINMDSTRDAFEKCIEDREITWVNIVSEGGWEAPMAQHYGITGIPTAILVDKEGKVVSLRARGRELDRLLEDLLGAPESEEAKDEDAASPQPLKTIE